VAGWGWSLKYSKTIESANLSAKAIGIEKQFFGKISFCCLIEVGLGKIFGTRLYVFHGIVYN